MAIRWKMIEVRLDAQLGVIGGKGRGAFGDMCIEAG